MLRLRIQRHEDDRLRLRHDPGRIEDHRQQGPGSQFDLWPRSRSGGCYWDGFDYGLQ